MGNSKGFSFLCIVRVFKIEVANRIYNTKYMKSKSKFFNWLQKGTSKMITLLIFYET